MFGVTSRMLNKPPYYVPCMEEVLSVKPIGRSVISTFSGGGGSSLGYRMAGYKVLLASEFVESAAKTYQANFPDTMVDTRDIRKVHGQELLDQVGLEKGELDILDGSPPCSSFSSAGSREKGWGKVKEYSDVAQRTDDLFFEYARLIDEIKPKVFVAENVSGLVKGKAKGYFLEILARLKSCGYRVKGKVLDAKWLGVPQSRQRTIFVGIREDLNMEPVHPDPLPYCYTLREAIDGCTEPIEIETDINRFAIGREWRILRKPGTQSLKYFQLVRPLWNKPCPTITAESSNPGAASVCHPTQERKFSVGELKRICSFPPDYHLEGFYSQQVERMGRAVPPLMMKRIAERIAEEFKNDS